MSEMEFLQQIIWDQNGLVPAIAQDADSQQVLMLAWMNRESLQKTIQTGEAVYWSRSRQRLWHKGEESGHIQQIVEIRLDCDGDALLLKVKQHMGIACHTGRQSCFFYGFDKGSWKVIAPVLQDPQSIYSGKS